MKLSLVKQVSAKRVRKDGPIRLCVVDDDELHIAGIRETLKTNPVSPGDIQLVGTASKNEPAEIEAICNANPDVIFVDGVLEFGRSLDELDTIPESDGIAACKQIRTKLGTRPKIVLYTQYPELRERWSKLQVSDYIVLKGLAGEAFRQKIRDIHNGHNPEIVNHGIKGVVELHLFPSKYVIELRDETRKLVTVKLTHDLFPFLHYLALECQQHEQGWVARGETEGRLKFTRTKEWSEIGRASEHNHRGVTEIERELLAQWTSKINKRVRKWIVAPSFKLVIPRGVGRRAHQDNKHFYSLCPGVQKVEIHGNYSPAEQA